MKAVSRRTPSSGTGELQSERHYQSRRSFIPAFIGAAACLLGIGANPQPTRAQAGDDTLRNSPRSRRDEDDGERSDPSEADGRDSDSRRRSTPNDETDRDEPDSSERDRDEREGGERMPRGCPIIDRKLELLV
jgi:hypothetical protein